MNFDKYIENARKSKFGLMKLNWGLWYMIPFNKPHRIKVIEIGDHHVKTIIPMKRKNQNHIKGIHACGLATAAEFASGLLIITKLDGKKYRLIMESLEMKYHYQAKTDIVAEFKIEKGWIEKNVIEPLKKSESTYVRCEIMLHDANLNHVATGYTNWQVKDWEKVKTKL